MCRFSYTPSTDIHRSSIEVDSMSSFEATAAAAENTVGAAPAAACPAKRKAEKQPSSSSSAKKRSKKSHPAPEPTAAAAAAAQPTAELKLADAILSMEKPRPSGGATDAAPATSRKHESAATAAATDAPTTNKKRKRSADAKHQAAAAATGAVASQTTAVDAAAPAASQPAAAKKEPAAGSSSSSSSSSSVNGNLHVLIRHHGKIPFAKPVVIEWSPLPVLGRGSNYKPNPTGKPTERYQYLRLPASEDIVLKPLACQLVDMNYGIQFVGQNAHQLHSWSVHNWEPLMNEGVTVSYAEPIQQNIRLLVQNCSDQKVVIKQGDPLAIVRFHPLAKKLSLHYVPLSQ